MAAWSTLFGFIALLPWAGWEMWRVPIHVTAQAMAAAVYLSVVVTVVGLFLWLHLLRTVPARIAAGVQYLQPVIGIAAASAMFGDQLGILFVAGVLAVLGGLVLAMTSRIEETMNFTLKEVEKDRAVFEGNPGFAVHNYIGAVHGGYAATVLDSACGAAVHTGLTAEQGYTTVELKVCFHRPLKETSGPVKAEGTVLSLGRRVAFAEAKLTDAQGRLCASATSTLLIFDLGAEG